MSNRFWASFFRDRAASQRLKGDDLSWLSESLADDFSEGARQQERRWDEIRADIEAGNRAQQQDNRQTLELQQHEELLEVQHQSQQLLGQVADHLALMEQRRQLGVVADYLETVTKQLESAENVDPALIALVLERAGEAEVAARHIVAEPSIMSRILKAKQIVESMSRLESLGRHPAGIVNISMEDNARSREPELIFEPEGLDLPAMLAGHPAYRANQEEADRAHRKEWLKNAAQSLENDLARAYADSPELSEVMDRFCYARSLYGDLVLDTDNKSIAVRVENVYDAFAVLAAEHLCRDDIYDYVEKLEKLIEAAWHYLTHIDNRAPSDWRLDGQHFNHETVVEMAVARSHAIEFVYRGAHELLIATQDAKTGGISVTNSPSGFVMPLGFLQCAEQYCKVLARASEDLPPIDLQKMVASIGYFQSENCAILLERYFEALRQNLAEQARNSGLEWPMQS